MASYLESFRQSFVQIFPVTADSIRAMKSPAMRRYVDTEDYLRRSAIAGVFLFTVAACPIVNVALINATATYENLEANGKKRLIIRLLDGAALSTVGIPVNLFNAARCLAAVVKPSILFGPKPPQPHYYISNGKTEQE